MAEHHRKPDPDRIREAAAVIEQMMGYYEPAPVTPAPPDGYAEEATLPPLAA